MAIIPWDKNLETKIPLIDNQHKRFLLKANLFYIKCKVNNSFEDCEADLLFLENFLLSHLQVEEAFQKDLDYPQFHHHQAAHDRLRMLIRELGIRLRSNTFSEETLQEFCDFIETWIKDHLFLEDMKFARYYQEK